MDRIRIRGGGPLRGEIPISGAKNAALPLMIASLLCDETLHLRNVPRLADVTLLGRILGDLGVDLAIDGKRRGQNGNHGQGVHLTARAIVDTTAPYELVSRMLQDLFDQRYSPVGGSMHRLFDNERVWQDAIQEHQAIYDAIAERDPLRAQVAMQQHLSRAHARLMAVIG